MTPGIKLAKKSGIAFGVHEYKHDENCTTYASEAAEQLGVNPKRIFKTLVVALNSGAFVMAVLPSDKQLDLKLIASHFKAKKAAMATPEDVERLTGYVLGGVSPLGPKKRLPLVLDNTATEFNTIFISAGRRGLEIELAASALLDLTQGLLAPIGKR